MFSSKTLISFQLKKERHGHLDDMGVSKSSAKVYLEVTTPLKANVTTYLYRSTSQNLQEHG